MVSTWKEYMMKLPCCKFEVETRNLNKGLATFLCARFYMPLSSMSAILYMECCVSDLMGLQFYSMLRAKLFQKLEISGK